MSKFNTLYHSLINESADSKDLFIPLEMINLEWPRENSRDPNAGKWVDYNPKNTKARGTLDETLEKIDDELEKYGALFISISDKKNGILYRNVPEQNHDKIRKLLTQTFKALIDMDKEGDDDAGFCFRIKKQKPEAQTTKSKWEVDVSFKAKPSKDTLDLLGDAGTITAMPVGKDKRYHYKLIPSDRVIESFDPPELEKMPDYVFNEFLFTGFEENEMADIDWKLHSAKKINA